MNNKYLLFSFLNYRKGKIIHQFQSQLVHVYFSCLSVGSEEKAEIAYECSDDENMDFSVCHSIILILFFVSPKRENFLTTRCNLITFFDC